MPWRDSPCDIEARRTNGEPAGRPRTSRVRNHYLKALWSERHGVTWPEGMWACHHCDDPRCGNPEHIFPGSASDNNRDMHRKGRSGGSIHKAGERHRFSKLTLAQVLRIRASKQTQERLALEYGVTQTAISRIKSGKRWRVA